MAGIAGMSRLEGFLPEDIGRRIYMSGSDLVAEPDETRRKRGKYPIIAELRDRLNVAVLHDVDEGTYALGRPSVSVITPSVSTEAELEEYCKLHFEELCGLKPN